MSPSVLENNYRVPLRESLFSEDVALVDLIYLAFLAGQLGMTVGNAGLCYCLPYYTCDVSQTFYFPWFVDYYGQTNKPRSTNLVIVDNMIPICSVLLFGERELVASLAYVCLFAQLQGVT